MTPDELQALDQMLAEKVMGYHRDMSPVFDGYVIWKDGEEFVDYDWHPTTDIAQAFMVAEKIGSLELMQEGPLGASRWAAHFRGIAWNIDKTAPLAICLAAKAWLERDTSKCE